MEQQFEYSYDRNQKVAQRAFAELLPSSNYQFYFLFSSRSTEFLSDQLLPNFKPVELWSSSSEFKLFKSHQCVAQKRTPTLEKWNSSWLQSFSHVSCDENFFQFAAFFPVSFDIDFFSLPFTMWHIFTEQTLNIQSEQIRKNSGAHKLSMLYVLVCQRTLLKICHSRVGQREMIKNWETFYG